MTNIENSNIFYTHAIDQIWRQINEIVDKCHKKIKNYGSKRVDIMFEKICDILLSKCNNFCSIAKSLELKSKLKLENYITSGVLH